jgi:thymidylate kinase
VSDYKLITLTGLDRIGKQTQVGLLREALKPSEFMTYPEYGDGFDEGHWAAQFVRAALDKDFLTLGRYSGTDGGVKKMLEVWPNKSEPHIFQGWQMADRLDNQIWIKETLKRSHMVADRYEVDALAYGAADGCSIDWLLATHRLYYPSDLVIAMVGQPFSRPGEAPDLNEKHQAFQDKVRRYFEAWGTLLGWHILDVDQFRNDELPAQSILDVHREICRIIRRKLDLTVTYLTASEVEQITCPTQGAA